MRDDSRGRARRRTTPEDALRLLDHDFPASVFLGSDEAGTLSAQLPRLRISGGAVYDALVGAAARQHRRRLVSADARARAVYEALGVEVELLSAPRPG